MRRQGSSAVAGGAAPGIASRLTSSANAFDALRLAAALLVLLNHGFGLVGRPLPRPFGGFDPGEIALLMFFAMSGFLVTASWQSAPVPALFARKRALRILPALVVVAVVTAFVLGPLVTTVPVGEYFTSVQTYAYVAWNSLLMTWHQDLPGVFTHLGFHHGAPIYAVNGSLWTLPVEVGAYTALACGSLLLGRFGGRLGGPHLLVPIAGGLILVSPLVDIGRTLQLTPQPGALTQIVELYVAFACGSLMWTERARLRFSRVWAAVAGAAALAFPVSSPWHDVAYALAVPYLVLFAAFGLPAAFRGLGQRIGDLSYGVYITAYPIQQTVAKVWGPSLRPAEMLLLSTPAALLAARASWRFVERPALARKRPAPAPVEAPVVPAAAVAEFSG